MKEYKRILKEWNKLAKPNKFLLALSFFMIVLVQVCLIVAPIFAAKVTIAITNLEYVKTILYLLLVFAILAVRKSFWHVNYLIYAPLVKSIYVRINNEFLSKGLNAKSSNFKSTSKEKILNMVHTDVYTVADFADKISIASARLVMTIVNIIVIFCVNIWAGLIVFVADILDFLMLNFVNSKREKWLRKIRESNDTQYEKFSEIIDARDTIKDLGLEKNSRKEYNKILDDYIYRLNKSTFWDSLKSNYYEVFYQFLILIATIICVIFVSKNSLSLEGYFIIVSYVTNGITNTKDLYSIIYDFKNVNVATSRVKNVLNFIEKDEIEYGKNNLKDILGNLCFCNVSYKRDDEGNPALKNFDVMFKENETSLIIGTRNCGKRTVFNLLRRNIQPTNGEITLDGINLYDFNKSSYKDNFSYVTTKPVFFKGSIIKNLSIYEKNKKIIYEICKELDVYNYIMSLPKKFNTDIRLVSYDKLYLLGIARAILNACEVLILYEFPENLTDLEKENVKRILNKMHGTRTILIFTAKEHLVDMADKIIEIENGSIKSITFNKNPLDK